MKRVDPKPVRRLPARLVLALAFLLVACPYPAFALHPTALARSCKASTPQCWGSHTLTSNLPNATFAGVCVEFLRPVCLQHRVPHDPFVLPEK